MKSFYYYEIPEIGKIGIGTESGAITDLHFEKSSVERKDFEVKETELHKKAHEQLLEYFAGKRKIFDLPLAPQGTDFQKKVWKALTEIPYGETRTYGEVAAAVGVPKGPRAVGLANNRNPIALIIPCHRVIGSNGSLVGFGGGLHVKKYLLEMEHFNALFQSA